MTYRIDPSMSYLQVISYYKRYLKDVKTVGKEPVSFLHFITGRY